MTKRKSNSLKCDQIADWIKTTGRPKSALQVAKYMKIPPKDAMSLIAGLADSKNYLVIKHAVGGVKHYWIEKFRRSNNPAEQYEAEKRIWQSPMWKVAHFGGAQAGVMGVNGLGRV